jgi:hypothetical protein
MYKLKIALAALLGLAVAFGGGWMWGASGRWACERQLQSTELDAQLIEARASLSAARIDLFELNFGRAGAATERAKQALSAAAGRLDRTDRAADAAAVRDVLAMAGDGQRMTANLDQAANARLAAALDALARVSAASRR